MKYSSLLVIMLFVACGVQAQEDWSKYSSIASVNGTNPAQLASKITSGYADKLDKIKAIYYWVTHNIKYDYAFVEKGKGEKIKNATYSSKADWEKKLDQETTSCLKRRRGVCTHYSLVMQSLCLHAGIEAEIVRGWVKTQRTSSSSMGGSHAWNAIKYNDEWHLVDATFGAGSLDDKRKFHFRFEPAYFFTSPDAFILNHFPAEEKWQMVDLTIDKDEFKSYPYVGSGYLANGLSMLTPLTRRAGIEKGGDFTVTFNSDEQIDNITCRNISTRKLVELNVVKEKSIYTLVIKGSKFRSGKYMFLAADKFLFAYQLAKM